MMQGYFTPTEAGSVGAFAVLIISLARKDVNLKGFIKSIFDSLNIACMVLILIAGGTVLGHFFAVTNITFATVDWLSSLALRRELIMLIIFLIILIGGSFIDDLAFLILIIPILLPLVNKLGYDLVWFGIVMQAVMMLGIIIPPIAVNVFVVSSVAQVPLATVYRGAFPFAIVMAIWVVILLIFPQISLWLPNLLMK
jgi:tripartite ATP-independent transporter DctM subunit